MNEMPKDFNRRAKPDFLANAPRLIMQGGPTIEDLESIDDIENDPVKALDPSSRPTVYYPSTKTLGLLYRNIDETGFLRNLQLQRGHPEGTPLLKRVWDYVRDQTSSIQWQHMLDKARTIKTT